MASCFHYYLSHVVIRHTDQPAEVYTNVEFKIISHQVDDYISPSGKKCVYRNCFHAL